MSEQHPPTPAERDAEVDRVLRWVCGRLLDLAPPDAVRLDLKVTMASTVEDFTCTTVAADGSARTHELPQDVHPAFADLRDLLYEPGRGTWLSVRLVIDPPDTVRVTFNFDVDPVWDPPVGPELLAKDLEDYPRDELPPWLHHTLTGETAPLSADPEDHARRIGDQLHQTLPPGWEHARVRFREVGDHAETDAVVHTVGGAHARWEPPRAVTERFRELRAATRGDSAWYSAEFELRAATGEQRIELNRDDEPTWTAPPPAEAYREELRLSGGTAEALPTWVRAKLP
ncbi:hypothetical protein LZG04_25790 [Saccharothrix sp. S26]|uniref:hypothetical protein n=1 Tax=Saccharothrix sp. S26 TaxID=2907215 RepID=UPI001F3357EA|nr:hypothetical protein [Saccharothrix sp. S26]MCE6998183.1 hypothetical protein [Saccharothrix sp. S26]